MLLLVVRVFYFSSTNNAISRDDIIGLEKVLKNAAANAESFKYVRRSTVQGPGKVESSRMTVATPARNLPAGDQDPMTVI